MAERLPLLDIPLHDLPRLIGIALQPEDARLEVMRRDLLIDMEPGETRLQLALA